MIAGIFGGSGFVAPCTRVLSNSDLSRRFVHRTSDRSRSEVLCTHGGQPSELVQSPSENDKGGRHRQTWRWSTPARIVGCGDASSRSVATAGDLVPSSAMAMLQLDVRGLVVSASSDAAMLERGEKK
ncbi:MAG: hypothetical protein NZ734_00620, partial [Paracoccus sp.]|nr:hypothetical protein [Paracoccus sp. (in: a-proteobacteria)]